VWVLLKKTCLSMSIYFAGMTAFSSSRPIFVLLPNQW